MSVLTLPRDTSLFSRVWPYIPGLAFSATAGVFIYLGDRLIDSVYYDGLLVALVFGIVVKNLSPAAGWHEKGDRFAGRTVLEFAVMILGASVFMPDITESGFGLLALIVAGVIGGMGIAYLVGHVVLGLNRKLATLIGVGNSICGNSAIAVMAPVIKAQPTDVAAAIGISAILGAAQILLLQFLAPIFGLSDYHYGIVAGMAVYAMAQVYSASAVVSQTSASVAVVVKLTRVLMLSPMVIAAQMIQRRNDSNAQPFEEPREARGLPWRRPTAAFVVTRWIPWFVLGFIVLSTFRSTGVIGADAGGQVRDVSKLLFVIAMVAIGMGVDLRSIISVGPKVAATIGTVLIFMITLSIVGGSFLETV